MIIYIHIYYFNNNAYCNNNEKHLTRQSIGIEQLDPKK